MGVVLLGTCEVMYVQVNLMSLDLDDSSFMMHGERGEVQALRSSGFCW